MTNKAVVSSRIEIKSDGPIAEIQLGELRDFLNRCAAAGVPTFAALWTADADGRERLVRNLSVRAEVGSGCMFVSNPSPGMGVYSCSSNAVKSMFVPIRDSSSHQSGSQVQRNFHGEGVDVRVCESHARVLADQYGAVDGSGRAAVARLAEAAAAPAGRFIGLGNAVVGSKQPPFDDGPDPAASSGPPGTGAAAPM